jgi:predicted nucleic acid-binding protein
MQIKYKYLLETDILSDHLVNGKNENSILIDLMQKGICYTTVLNASELLFFTNSDKEVEYVKKILNAVKVLGLHSRYSLSIYNYSRKVDSIRDALFSVVADINKLPIVTFDNIRYINTGLKIFHPQDLRG